MDYGYDTGYGSKYYDTGYTTPSYGFGSAPMSSLIGANTNTGFNLTDYTPMGMLKNQIWCMAIGIIVFMILMWLISLIPIIGPWISSTIKYMITKLAEFAGVLNCGFANDFDDVLEAEK